jgi:hypothetical protein
MDITAGRFGSSPADHRVVMLAHGFNTELLVRSASYLSRGLQRRHTRGGEWLLIKQGPYLEYIFREAGGSQLLNIFGNYEL